MSSTIYEWASTNLLVKYNKSDIEKTPQQEQQVKNALKTRIKGLDEAWMKKMGQEYGEETIPEFMDLISEIVADDTHNIIANSIE